MFMTRREMLAAAAVSLTPTITGAAEETGEKKKPGYIDAHSHIWPPETDKYPLANGQTKQDLKPASFTDDELMALAAPEGIDRVVLIQHSVYHLFDNSYLVDAVQRHPQRFRVVGMVDDRGPRPGEQMVQLFKQGVTGFRITPFIRKDQPEKWLATDGMAEMWKTGAKTRQNMCCLINPADLPGVEAMCEKHPETPVVIDHFARIGTEGMIREADLKALCSLKKYKHVTVKISAYYALGEKKPPHLELVPMIKRLLGEFGPERLMWASDAPYQVQGENTYHDSIALIRDRIEFLTDADKTKLLRTTAERVFFFA